MFAMNVSTAVAYHLLKTIDVMQVRLWMLQPPPISLVHGHNPSCLYQPTLLAISKHRPLMMVLADARLRTPGGARALHAA